MSPIKKSVSKSAKVKGSSQSVSKKSDCSCVSNKKLCPEITVTKTVVETCSVVTPEKNLKRLSESSILNTFVEKNCGEWDHAKWISLCEEIKNAGFFPIDFDQVGLMLESLKAEYNS